MPAKKYSNRKMNNDSADNNGVVGVILIIVSVFFLMCMTFSGLISAISLFVRDTTIGLIGYSAYPFFICTLISGVSIMRNKKPAVSMKNIACIVSSAIVVVLLLQLITTGSYMDDGIFEYIDVVYKSDTVGGIIYGVIAFGLTSALSTPIAYVFLVLILLILLGVVFSDLFDTDKRKARGYRRRKEKPQSIEFAKGRGQSTLVQTVNNNGLFVDKIISQMPEPQPEPTRERVRSDQGRFDEIQQDQKFSLSKYGNKVEFEKYPKRNQDNSEKKYKSDAHKILFGDGKQGKTTSSASSFSANKTSFSSNSGSYDTQMDLYNKFTSNFIPGGSGRPSTPQPHGEYGNPQKTAAEKYGLREIAIPPTKDISSQIIDGVILNGDSLSEDLKNSGVSVKPTIESSGYNGSRQEADDNAYDSRSGIINGDFFKREKKPEPEPKRENNPYQQQNSGAVNNPYPQQNSGTVNNPYQQQNSGTVNNPYQQQNSGTVNNPYQQQNSGTVNNPYQQQNSGTVNNPYQQQNSGTVNNPYQQQNSGTVNNPYQQQNSGTVNNPYQQQNSGVVNNPYQQQTGGSSRERGLEDLIKADKSINRFDVDGQNEYNNNYNQGCERQPSTHINPNINNEQTTISGVDAYPNNSYVAEGNEEYSDGRAVVEDDYYEPFEEEESSFGDDLKIALPDSSNFTDAFSMKNDDIKTVEISDNSTDGSELTTDDRFIVGDLFAAAENELSELPKEEDQKTAEQSVGMRIADEVIDKSETDFAEARETGYYERHAPKKNDNVAFGATVNGIERNVFKNNDVKLKPENQIGIDDYLKVAEPRTDKPVTKKKRSYKYVPPPIDLLLDNSTDISEYGGDCEKNAKILEDTLKSLKFPAKVIGITTGPAVTRYELETPPGIPIKRVESCAKDIAYALASEGRIRIETPIPGRRAVGIEVPNEEIAIVCLRDIINSKEFVNSASNLTLAIGKDITGNIITSNLEKMPHLLIAGSTGSGKSACLNSIITSILYKASPEDVRLILIDPKQVEFAVFKDMPHLLMKNIVTEPAQAINAFKWAKAEMERRYKLFSRYVAKNIQEFNSSSHVKTGAESKLPYIVMIVDELSDLMMSHNRKELEDKIMSMAQKSRAAGIHLILATQRPSVDVITGTIKANLPSRIAFSVASIPDSRTILDQSGAEALVGRGDMLYSPLDSNDPKRVQGAYITSEEVAAVVEYVKENNNFDFDDEAEQSIMKLEEEKDDDSPDAEESIFDPLMLDAVKRVIETGQASTSMIQRRFSVGYARAARIMDQMELHKFVGPSEGAKPREVYITREQFKEIFGEDV